MLNTNPTRKRNSWKYILILPILIGFIFLFQIKVIAQEKENDALTSKLQSGDGVHVVIDKNYTDDQMKKDAALLKEKHGITLKCSKIKRNDAGEITGIKVEYKDKEGNKGVTQVNGKEPIKPIRFYKYNSGIGFGGPKEVRIFTNTRNEERAIELATEDSAIVADNFDFDFDMEAPEVPEVPETPEAPEAPASKFAKMPKISDKIHWDNESTKVIIKKEGEKPIVLINGVQVDGEDENNLSKEELEMMLKTSKANRDSENAQIIINGQDMMKIRSEALANADIQLKRMKPMMQRQMELVKSEKSRVKTEMDKARAEMEASKPEMEKAKAEMIKAKEEMLEAKAEMLKAKAELDNERAKLKKAKSK